MRVQRVSPVEITVIASGPGKRFALLLHFESTDINLPVAQQIYIVIWKVIAHDGNQANIRTKKPRGQRNVSRAASKDIIGRPCGGLDGVERYGSNC